MTERYLSEIQEDILRRLDSKPMTIKEICDAMPEDDQLVSNLLLVMAGRKQIMLEPGSMGKRWITGAKARAMLKAEGGDGDAERVHA